jgi:hypothetical protein
MKFIGHPGVPGLIDQTGPRVDMGRSRKNVTCVRSGFQRLSSEFLPKTGKLRACVRIVLVPSLLSSEGVDDDVDGFPDERRQGKSTDVLFVCNALLQVHAMAAKRMEMKDYIYIWRGGHFFTL